MCTHERFLTDRCITSNGLGAKSQNLSYVAPTGRKKWLLFSVKGMYGALKAHALLSLLRSIFCK